MQCPNCGQENNQEARFCPNCGTALTSPPEQPAAESQPSQEILQAERNASVANANPANAYWRRDYNPAQDGRFKYSAQQTAGSAGSLPDQMGQRPSTTGMVVFSIVNMLCCGLGVGFILGVIALIYAIMASSEASYEEARHKLSTARTLNIIGLVFIILQVVAFFGFIVLTVIFSRDYGTFR